MDTNIVIALAETLDRAWVEKTDLLQKPCGGNLILDFSQTKRIDSAAICTIRLLHNTYKNKGRKLVLRNISPPLLSALETVIEPTPDLPESDRITHKLLINAGDSFLTAKETVISALSVLTEMLYWGTFGVMKKRDFRKGILGEQMFLLGYKALGIVGLLSFLIGMVLALQAAIQLKTFGAGVFLGPLIGITMVREMGPLLTAVILAGRTGSATTAEIGTMGVGEELDALKTMGINPVQFVVVPKFWAISLTMPVLSICGTVAGILGGWCVALFYLDLSSSLYWGQLWQYLLFSDVLAGFIKSVVFSWLIVWIGAFYGFRVRGGAEGVGRETTASVVSCIFIIIITDALFSFII
ncbi:MAG: MlaE family lipid ABC transporter permease subunit [Chitinispirillaceae bacterium]|jgi:phospholipid/cholesterol/gamma-HCH transport system permease protein